MSTGKLVNDATRQLKDWLETGKFKEGDRLPSERAIASEIGIKYYGVNRAMARLIAEGRVVRDGYRLSLATPPRSARRSVFHLVVSHRSQHLASHRRAAANLDIELVVHTWVAVEEFIAILKELDSKETDGVVCDPPTRSVHSADWVSVALQLIRHGIPVVCTGGWGVHGALSSVGAKVHHGVTLGLSHLIGIGHRELALVAMEGGNESEIGGDDYWNRLCVRNHLDSSAERILFQPSGLAESKDIDALVDLLIDGPWKNVTGLVALTGYSGDVQSLFTKLARKGRRVPESLSFVAVGNCKALASVEPRVTSVVFDMVLWSELTFDLLQREVREQRQFGVSKEPASIQILPRLTVRDSTVAVGEGKPVGMETGLSDGPDGEALDRLVRQPYSLAAKASLSARPRFAPVNLRPFVNRPLIFRRGWLGDIPLRCFEPGLHEIHGVPFEILGGSTRADAGALIFQSAVNTTGNAKKLPDRVVVPLTGLVEAVYILHGCGYAKPMQTFAHYDFYSKKGKVDTVPLVSLGMPEQRIDAGKGAGLAANIQDWWSDFPHVDFPHARMAPLRESKEPGQGLRHAFLYTLEWINPSPKQPLTHIEITVDASVATTLGVLAITLVRPGAGA